MTPSAILWEISSLLLVAHISYGGWFIMARYKKTDTFITIIGIIIAASLAWMVFSIGTANWFWSLIVAFLSAILFHLHLRRRLNRVCLQEFCNYKIFIESYGVILCLGGFIFSLFFPQQDLLLGILNLLFVLRLNWLIFFKKKLYRLDYPNPKPLTNPLVSVVIIAFNEEKYIGQCLESLKKQTYHNFEVILVDDRSVDSTVSTAEPYGQFFPLKIVQKEVRGCSRSRNFGAENACGKIILFLDADVILPTDFLEKSLHEFFAQHLSAAFFDFTPITDKKIDYAITCFYRLWLKATQYHNPRAIGSCIMVRRELHDAIRFDETVIMAEDFDYIRRATDHGKFRMIDQVRYRLSWRRFTVENRLKLVIKYLLFELHRQLIGEMRKPVFSYNFGHYDKKEP